MTPETKKAYVPSGWETVSCLFCGAAEATMYEKFGSELQYQCVKCKGCGLIYTNPRPVYDQEFLEAAYASYYQYADTIQVKDLDSIRESSLGMFENEINYISRYDSAKNRCA